MAITRLSKESLYIHIIYIYIKVDVWNTSLMGKHHRVGWMGDQCSVLVAEQAICCFNSLYYNFYPC
jgi:hypothetical protein